MPIKISQLPNNTFPYSGGEEIPLVQSGETRVATLNSLLTYLSGSFSSSTGSNVANLSGNWQSTYTTVNSKSANWDSTYTTYKSASGNYAVKNANNNFSASQTIVGNLNVGSVNIDSIYNIDSNAATSISVSDVNEVGFHSVEIGVKSNPIGWTPVGLNVTIGYGVSPLNPPDESVLIGAYAGSNAVTVQRSIMIGRGAGETFGHNSDDINNIFIGLNAGKIGGSNLGATAGSIFIGNNTCVGGAGSHSIIIGSNSGCYGNNAISLGKNNTASHSDTLLLGNNIGTTTSGIIYIGSASSPFLHHASSNDFNSYGSGFVKLQVKVNDVDYYIPLLPS